MFNQTQVQAAREHYDDLIREARYMRVVRQVAKMPAGHDGFYGQTLAWIGRQLTLAGWQLVNRYGDINALSPLWTKGASKSTMDEAVNRNTGTAQLSLRTELDCLCNCTDCHGTISVILPDVL